MFPGHLPITKLVLLAVVIMLVLRESANKCLVGGGVPEVELTLRSTC